MVYGQVSQIQSQNPYQSSEKDQKRQGRWDAGLSRTDSREGRGGRPRAAERGPPGRLTAVTVGNARRAGSPATVVRAKPKQALFCSYCCDPFWLKTSLRGLGNEWYLETRNRSPTAKLVENSEKSSSALLFAYHSDMQRKLFSPFSPLPDLFFFLGSSSPF